ncbi:hypothetical protein PTTG_10194 [Puccinia triticina 1-1 BBBD Race 1]|uniref:Uncharacterized protein n=1 Tax=Puccinia triticina (isolate 1-1 / race 1 (BBBD)) TaxID=630390 RepID=A0A0C4FAF3_PUCT1|nr:hypothetical protein PTTG_10194 [Puccinia triticina 1-1 BBBD Race 1]
MNLGNLLNPQVKPIPVSSKDAKNLEDEYVVNNFEDLEASDFDGNSDRDSHHDKSDSDDLGDEDNTKPDLGEAETLVASNAPEPLKLKLKLPPRPTQETLPELAPLSEQADQPAPSANEVKAVQRRSKRTSRK